jgi:hypothetical protein
MGSDPQITAGSTMGSGVPLNPLSSDSVTVQSGGGAVVVEEVLDDDELDDDELDDDELDDYEDDEDELELVVLPGNGG